MILKFKYFSASSKYVCAYFYGTNVATIHDMTKFFVKMFLFRQIVVLIGLERMRCDILNALYLNFY